MAKAREIPGLAEAASFRDAAALAVETRTHEVFEQAEGVLDTGDIERVHDMRVATRRLRAAMEIFAPAFPKQEHRSALKQVKELADALGARRDPDVAIEELERIAAALTRADMRGIQHLIDAIRGDQEAGNETLARVLHEVEESGLRERLLALAQSARSGS